MYYRTMVVLCEKPPKTKDDDTILTHHQRAHVKLNRYDMFGKDSMLKSDNIEISFGDKAYIRPGTDGKLI